MQDIQGLKETFLTLELGVSTSILWYNKGRGVGRPPLTMKQIQWSQQVFQHRPHLNRPSIIHNLPLS